jgi:eukaryotic-like serine/threonine-protein kinase
MGNAPDAPGPKSGDATLPLGSGGAAAATSPSGVEATLPATPSKPASGIDATLPAPDTASGDRADYDDLVAVESAHYVFGRELARGGMGRIITARDRRLGREVAVKTLLGTNLELRRRFEREARVTARLQHPAIVPVYEAGKLASGEPFYAMKLVSGRALDAVIADAATIAARIALLPKVIVVAEALAYAHSERVIHRDLKPQNILVGDFGETVVIDWGLAKDLASSVDDVPVGPYRGSAGDGNLTQVGSVMGTPAYMPPEQARGDAVDASADVYALGAILYHALAGGAPVRGTTAKEVLDKVLAGPPPPLAEVAPETPRDLATLVDAAMARDPAARPSSKQLAEELRRFQAGQLVATHAYSFGELARRWLRRHRVAVGVGAAALAVLAIVSVLGIRQILVERDVATTERTTAQLERARAEQTSQSLLEEQGRRELLDGEYERAAVWLAAAYAATDAPSPALRYLLAEALVPLEAPRVDLGTHASVSFAGDRLEAVDADNVVRVLSFDGREIARKTSSDVAVLATGKRGTVTRDASGVVRLAGTQLASGGVEWAAFLGDQIALATPGGVELVDGSGQRIRKIAGPTKGWSITADQKFLRATDAAGAVGVWELATGKRTLTLPAPSGDRSAHIVLFGDGKRLAAVDRDRSIGIWDIASGTRQIRIADPHGDEDAGVEDHISWLVVDDKGELLATAGHDSQAAVFDTRTGNQLAKFNVTGQASPEDMFFLKGRLVTANRWDGIGFWDPRKGIELSRIGDLTGDVDVSADGERLVTGAKLTPSDTFRAEDAVSTIYSTTGGVIANLQHGDRVEGTKFVDGDQRVITWGGRRLRVWDLGGQLLATLVHTAGIEGVTDHDGWFLVKDTGGRWLLWQPHLGAGRLVASFEAMEAADGLELDPAGSRILVTGYSNSQLHDASTGKLLTRRNFDAFWDPSFTRILFAYRTEAIVVDAASLRELISLRGNTKAIEHAAWSPDGKRIATAGQDKIARVWDAASGQLLVEIPHDKPVDLVVFHPDSRRLLTVAETTARLFDGTREVAKASLDKYSAPMFDAHGTRLLTSAGLDREGGLQILDGSTLASITKLPAGGPATFSADGTRILTFDEDGARLLDAHGAAVATMPRLGTETARFAGRDDSLVLVGGKDSTVTIWDLRGRLLGVMHGPTSLINRLAAARDGARIAAADARSRLHVWNIAGETRPVAAINAIVAARSAWRLDDNRLVPR